MTTAADRDRERAAARAGRAGAGRLGVGFLGVYSAGSLFEVAISFALGQFLLFYLTIVCGLSGALAGLVGLISLSVDAFIDPLVGSISDNLRSKFGRRHPFLIIASVPSAVALVLLFSVPDGLHGSGLFAYAAVLSLTLRVGLSCFQIPYFALGAEISDDYAERSTIVGWRFAFSIVGRILAIALSYGYFLAGPHATTHKAAYVPLAWSFAAIVASTGLACGLGTLGARGRLHTASAAARITVGGLITEIHEIFRNRSFRILFWCTLLLFIGQGLETPLELYANIYFWKISTAQIRDLANIYTGGMAAGIIFVRFASRRLEKRTIAFAGLTMVVLSQLLPAPLRLLGFLPTTADAMAALVVAWTLLGLGVSAAVVGSQSMMADAADEHEHLFLTRREGLYFAGVNFSAKMSSGVGLLVAGVGLDLIGFPHGVGAAGSAAHVPPGAVTVLGLVYGPGAAIISFLSATMLFGYRINRGRHAEILRALGRGPGGGA